MNTRRLLNVKKAALVAQVPLRTMYNWVNTNKVQSVRSSSGRIRIYVDSVPPGNIDDVLNRPWEQRQVGICRVCPACHGLVQDTPEAMNYHRWTHLRQKLDAGRNVTRIDAPAITTAVA